MSTPALYRLPQSNGDSAAGIYLGAIVTVITVIGFAIWAATQYTAYRLGYHPALGAPLLWLSSSYRPLLGPAAVAAGALGAVCAASPRWRHAAVVLLVGAALLLALRVGPLYAPLNFFFWWWRFGNIPLTGPIWRAGMWVVSVPSHLAVFLAIVLAVRRAKKLGGPTDTHGSAHWAQRKDLEAAELIGRDAGVYIGAWPERKTLHYLRHAGPQHVLAFAPSRSGKGVGLVLPTLLSWAGSRVVNDIKGENWALTAGWRQQALGSACLKFDPTAAPGAAARYNPLLEVRPWPSDVRDAQLIADMLIDPDGQGTRDHWDLTAHDLLVGVILHVLYAEQRDKTRPADRPMAVGRVLANAWALLAATMAIVGAGSDAIAPAMHALRPHSLRSPRGNRRLAGALHRAEFSRPVAGASQAAESRCESEACGVSDGGSHLSSQAAIIRPP